MSEARIYPPSEQRMAEAKRAGHGPRTSLLSVAGAWSGAVAGAWLTGEEALTALRALWSAVLLAPEGQRHALALAQLTRLGTGLLVVSACAWGASVLSTALGQGVTTKLPLAAPGRAFAKLKPARTPKLLALIMLGLVFALALRDAMAVGALGLTEVATRLVLRCLVVLLACALVDAGLARARYFRSLWLTRREHLDAQREAYGAPEVRKLRAQRRHEARRGGV